MALNPSWRLYSDSRTLLRLDRLERGGRETKKAVDTIASSPARAAAAAAGAAVPRAGAGAAAAGPVVVAAGEVADVPEEAGGAGAGGRGGGGRWREPPSARHHPLSDFVWFSDA